MQSILQLHSQCLVFSCYYVFHIIRQGCPVCFADGNTRDLPCRGDAARREPFLNLFIEICRFIIEIIPCVYLLSRMDRVEVKHGKIAGAHRGMHEG